MDTIVNSNSPVTDPHPIIFEQIDGQWIQISLHWAMWHPIAAVARWLSTIVLWIPGTRYISFFCLQTHSSGQMPKSRGIGETARRNISKAIALKPPRRYSRCMQQVFFRYAQVMHISGCEAAVHAMHAPSLWFPISPPSQRLKRLQFINREADFRNIQRLCPFHIKNHH